MPAYKHTTRDKAFTLNLARLESAAKDAIGPIPAYRRTAIYEYIAALQLLIEAREEEIDELANRIMAR